MVIESEDKKTDRSVGGAGASLSGGDVFCQEDVIAFLSRSEAFGTGPVDIRETHISFVFLSGDRVYKLKRNVKLHFLDFSSLEKRRIACEREILVNQSNAPEIYRQVVPVTFDGTSLAINGEGDVVEWLVEMNRFDERTLFSNLVTSGGLKETLIGDLAQQVARIHLGAERMPEFGGYTSVSATLNGVVKTLSTFAGDLFPSIQFETWERDVRAELAHQKRRLDLRQKMGFVRHCHGDMHLANICLVNGRPTPFDAIEFRKDFAAIDVLYDLAFPLMDLLQSGRPDLGNQLLNRYMEVTCDYSGLHLLPLFISIRAGVRAMVHALEMHEGEDGRADREAAQSYLKIADSVLVERDVSMVAVGGFSGTGKSTLARALACQEFSGAGAIVLRNDAIRKRIFRQSPVLPLPRRAYTPAVDDRVFREMCRDAHRALGAGWPVIVDATFLNPARRQAIEELADRKGASFMGFWLSADRDTLAKRVTARTNDVSDADVEVIALQAARDVGDVDWICIDAGQSAAETTDQARVALRVLNDSATL